MAPQLGQAGFRIGIFIVMMSGLLLLVLDRGSAEFILMSATFGCGLLFLAVLGVMVKVLSR